MIIGTKNPQLLFKIHTYMHDLVRYSILATTSPISCHVFLQKNMLLCTEGKKSDKFSLLSHESAWLPMIFSKKLQTNGIDPSQQKFPAQIGYCTNNFTFQFPEFPMRGLVVHIFVNLRLYFTVLFWIWARKTVSTKHCFPDKNCVINLTSVCR